MTAVVPAWIADSGAVIGYALAFSLLFASLAAAAAVVIRLVMKPAIDRIHDLLELHMATEERQMDRVSIALEIIAAAVGVHIPGIVVRGGSDEGDDPAP